MTPALAFTIAGFLFAMGVQLAIFAYYYGRLTMQVDILKVAVAEGATKGTVADLKADLATRASKEHVESLETNVDKLTALFQKFLIDVDTKLDRVRDSDQRDDARLISAVAHLEEYMELVASWIGERLGFVGRTLDEHERMIRKLNKANNLSDDRIPAQGGGGTTDTGRHQAVPPPPRPGVVSRVAADARSGSAGRVPPMPSRKSDPRTE